MRRLLLATAAVVAVSASVAQAQMVGVYVDNDQDFAAFTQTVWPVGVRLTYVDSEQPMSNFPTSGKYAASQFAASASKNLIPMLGLPMAGKGENADAAFKAIASGSQDAMINGVLQSFADQGYQNIILRPGFEMNAPWFSWGVTAANAADFVAAFQHIAALAHNFPSALVTVVFNPNIGTDNGLSIDKYYPGDAAVDVVALDMYGPAWGGPQPLDTSGSDTNLTLLWMMQTFAPAHHKPFGICETGDLYNNPSYPAQLAQAIQQSGSALLFLGVWASRGGGGMPDSLYPQDPATAAAWQALALHVSRGNGVPIASISQDYVPPPLSAVTVAASPAAHDKAPATVTAPVIALQRVTAPTSPTATAVSANNATVVGPKGAIIDASGNAWTITPGGQVAINGVIDPVTIEVTELAYVNGVIWQKAWGGDWWGESAPNGAWTGQPGTPTSPLPAKTQQQ